MAGNWKMNTTRAAAVELARAVAAQVPADRRDVEVLVCPPFPYLLPVGEAIRASGVKLGAQNCYFEPPGAFTGEIAVADARRHGLPVRDSRGIASGGTCSARRTR